MIDLNQMIKSCYERVVEARVFANNCLPNSLAHKQAMITVFALEDTLAMLNLMDNSFSNEKLGTKEKVAKD